MKFKEFLEEQKVDRKEEEYRKRKTVKVEFPQLSLRPGAGVGPESEVRDSFEIEWDEDEWSVYYTEADESFSGSTVKEIADNIKDFLASDEYVRKTGNYVISR